MKENLDQFYKMIQELALCGEKISEQLKCIVLLNSLPATYNSIKEIFECSNQELTLKSIIEAIKVKESRLNAIRGEQEAMLAKWKPPSEGHQKRYNNQKWKKAKEKKPEGWKCYYSRKEGHYIKECHKKSYDQKGKRPGGTHSKPGTPVTTSNSAINMFKNEHMVLSACEQNDLNCSIIVVVVLCMFVALNLGLLI